MTGKRAKQFSLLGLLAGAGLALVALTQPWAALGLHTDEFEREFTHSGGDSGTAIMGLAIAALAATGALAIAGRIFRYVIAVLTLGLGVGISVAAGVAMGNPSAGFSAEVRRFSGITDDAGIREIIAQGTVSTTAWPIAALVAGILIALAALGIIPTAHRWPGGDRKYDRSRFEPVTEPDESAENDRVSQWDALSAGDDPTDSDNENQIRR